jgi:hypothetical protein
MKVRPSAEPDTARSDFSDEPSRPNRFAGTDSMSRRELHVCIDRIDGVSSRLHSGTTIRMFDDNHSAITDKVARCRWTSPGLTGGRLSAIDDPSHVAGISHDAISDGGNRSSRSNININRRMNVSFTSEGTWCVIKILSECIAREWFTFNTQRFHPCPGCGPKHSVHRQALCALKSRDGLGEVRFAQSGRCPPATEDVHLNHVAQGSPTEQ